MSYSPPVQYGIHLVERENNYVVGFSIKNLSDSPVTLTRPCGSLYDISITKKSGDVLWEPSEMSTQAFTHWELAPAKRFTKHRVIPNRSDRDKEFESVMDNTSISEEDAQMHIPYIEPQLDCIINVELTPPMQSNYFCTIVKQYDLRQTTYDAEIDTELPAEKKGTLERKNKNLSDRSWY